MQQFHGGPPGPPGQGPPRGPPGHPGGPAGDPRGAQPRPEWNRPPGSCVVSYSHEKLGFYLREISFSC